MRHSADGGALGVIVSKCSMEMRDYFGTDEVLCASIRYGGADAGDDRYVQAQSRKDDWMTQRKRESQLDSDVQAHIGRQLRAGYVDILNQPVPSRFLELLAELDGKESQFGGLEDDSVRQKNGSR